MSRVLFVALDEEQVVARCHAEKVDISAIEKIPAGGVRLVCMSGFGAEQMRRKFKRQMITDPVTRRLLRPRTPIW